MTPQLLPFQQEGTAWLKSHFRCLLADEMGLGKTVQVLSLAQDLPGIQKVLIVCPASLKLNWVREMKMWAPKFTDRHSVLSGATIGKPSDFTVVNYDILAGRIDELAGTAWDLVVADEAHNLKNITAKRSSAFFGNLIAANRLILLSGTPIPNRPKELWPLLRALDEEVWADREKFEYAYCGGHYGDRGWWADGATNLGELNAKLQPYMLRRLKKDVLTELPDKFYQTVELETKNVWADKEDISLDEMATLRRQEGLAKVSSVCEHLEELLIERKKVVVFHFHREVGLALFNHFPRSVWVHGGTENGTRQTLVDRFRNETGTQLFIGQIQAAGEGITLTASDTVCFAELDWVPGRMNQATDRCHRIGQKNNVLVQHLVGEGTFDAWMSELLIKKSLNAGIALGDIDPVAEFKKYRGGK